jgi:hypothetical protein
MAGKPVVGFNVDTTEASALAGFMKQLSISISTPRHIGPVLRYAHGIMSEEFTAHMSTIAPAQLGRFHHVYEWGQVGDPNAQLWDDVLVGNGNNRVATFKWRASKQTVPVRDDFKNLGVKQIHVFVWKAPVMEYSQNITITPKRGKFLSYFTGPTHLSDKYAVAISSTPITVENPGGPLTRGSFTREYVRWWSGDGSSNIFANRINRVLSEDLGRMPIESAVAPFRRARNKTFTLQTLGDIEAAEKAGAAAAEKYLVMRSNKYIDAARARERLIEGNG